MFFQRWLIPVAIILPSEPFQVHVNVSFYLVTVPTVGFPVLMIIRPLSAVLWALGDGEITCNNSNDLARLQYHEPGLIVYFSCIDHGKNDKINIENWSKTCK